MPRICVDFSEKEYEILKELTYVKGDDSEKLRNLFRYYLSSIPALKSSYYSLKRFENKDEIEDILKKVLEAYKGSEYPTENWNDEKIKKLISDLTEINVFFKVDEKRAMPERKFRNLFKKVLYDIATERKDMDEDVAGYMAIIQLLIEFGVGTLDKETLSDATILINDGWLFAYPKAMKEAREFKKTRKLGMKLKPATKKQLQDAGHITKSRR